MSEERTISRQMLYEDLRGESNLRLLPANDSQRRLFLQLGKYLQEDTQRPIIVSSPVGFGSSFVRGFIDALRPPRTDVEWFGLAEMRNPLESIGALMNSLRRYATHDRRILIVLDDADKLSSLQLEKVIGHVFNWKRIKHLIIITNNSSLEVRRARKIVIDVPAGKLYGLKEQLVSPVKSIISVVGPQIITINDALIQRLKKAPADVFKISPRQFEEVIAELLTGMGMDVELTPETRDGGKDILAYAKTELGQFLTLVETKQFGKSRPVGVSLVRSLFGTVVDHGASTGMLVTTSRFAKPAQQFQERHKYQLSLRDYEDVVSWILKHKESG